MAAQMVSDDLLQTDSRSEFYKGAIHLALFALASVCVAYNCGACVLRPCRRLTYQALLYGALAAHEASQVKAHFAASGRG